ncbi:hypothetical protein [Nostoc sp. UIC 10630]|uniref:hypothetical protein n=1 Tax=Nostoc sp. UIC 10630 TaxID=2100146 RepID=UPI0013D7BFDB|nr:hypothetical protein [Nostoc sp. UIC 10630]NEU79429.1 hypothetical protein [Nostoc sp. UIC 10630]
MQCKPLDLSSSWSKNFSLALICDRKRRSSAKSFGSMPLRISMFASVSSSIRIQARERSPFY